MVITEESPADICVMIVRKENKKRNYNQWLISPLVGNGGNYLNMF